MAGRWLPFPRVSASPWRGTGPIWSLIPLHLWKARLQTNHTLRLRGEGFDTGICRNQAQRSEDPAPPCPGLRPAKLLFLTHSRLSTSWKP